MLIVNSNIHKSSSQSGSEIIISSVKIGFLFPLKKEVYLCNMKL